MHVLTSGTLPVLVLCDDRYHPAHVVRSGLAPLHGVEFDFEFVENAGDWSPARMANYPVVILTKSNNISSRDHEAWMTASIQHAFVDYVRAGNGLMAIHSGTADYQDAPELRQLLGGVFSQHPKQCPVTIVPAAHHALAAGCQPFIVQDEHYFMAMGDRAVDVFATSKSVHGEQTAGWTRREGDGRIAVLTPGHNLEVWLHSHFQTLLRNALGWCGGQTASTPTVA